MKIFKSEKDDVNLVLFFDYLSGKNTRKIYSEKETTQFELDVNSVLSMLTSDFYELNIALQDFDKDKIDIVILIPSEYQSKGDTTKLKYCDDVREKLQSHLITYNQDNTIFMPLGKYSLYTLCGVKDILKQAGKERNTIIDLSKLLDTLPEGVKKKDLIYKYRTIPNYNPSYLFYNKAVVNNFYFIFNQVRMLLNNEEIKEQETITFLEEDKAIQWLDDLFSKKDSLSHIYFDIETESVELSKVLGVSIDYDGNDIPVYIPILSKQIEQKIRQVLQTFPIVGHNLKFDIQQLLYNQIIKEGDYTIKDDTYILGHLIYNKTLKGLSLKHLAKTLIGVVEDWDKPLDEYKRKHKVKNYGDIPIDILGKYAGLDAYYTKKLYNKLMKEYKKEYDFLRNQYKEIVNMVMYWELKGVKISKEKLNQIENILIPAMQKARDTIYSLPSVKQYEYDKKKKLNINSTQQLSELVSNYLKLSEAKKKTPTGNIKLGRAELEELEEIYSRMYNIAPENEKIKEKYLFVKSLYEYKLYDKFIKSYIKPLKEKVDDYSIFRVDYNIGGTISGRLSSFFHLIPSRNDIGKNFKMLIEPRNKDYIMISADFCLTPDTLVYTNNGWKELINVNPDEDKVLNDKGEWLDVYCIVDRGEGEVYEIETEKGFKIKSTLNHKYMCIDNKGNYRLATLKEVIDNDYYLSIKTVDDTFKVKDLELDKHLKYKIDMNLVYNYRLFFDKIKNITYLGKQKVYDLSISGNHLFIANGFVVHNSQLEPRVMASLSKDKHLIEAYNTGKDLYKYMASKIFDIPYEEVPKDRRNQMKTLVLAILYGMSSNSLAKKLGIKKQEAKVIMENFFKEFSEVASWRNEQFINVKTNRKVITPLGREIPITNETDEELRKISVNYQIQSTASEVALILFKDIEYTLRNNNMKSFTVGSVHDSILIETHISEILQVISLLKNVNLFLKKNNFDFIRVPLKLDVNIGLSWANSLELVELNGNELTLFGMNVDYVDLVNRIRDYYNIKGEILDMNDIEVSDMSLYKTYNNKLRDILVKITLNKEKLMVKIKKIEKLPNCFRLYYIKQYPDREVEDILEAETEQQLIQDFNRLKYYHYCKETNSFISVN